MHVNMFLTLLDITLITITYFQLRNCKYKFLLKMDYLHEIIALSVDGLILGLCLKEYFSYKRTLDVLKVSSLTQSHLTGSNSNFNNRRLLSNIQSTKV